jgi:tRNA(adenine34) deaminase
MERNEKFMKAAISCARRAAKLGEVPVGCVIVRGDEIISRGYNRREGDKNALRHAEIIAIERACRRLDGWRLWECEMYVTLEPCPMCAGAILNSRVRAVYFGASDPKAGALGSVFNLFDYPLNHKPYVCGGILEGECSSLLRDFFKNLRDRG